MYESFMTAWIFNLLLNQLVIDGPLIFGDFYI